MPSPERGSPPGAPSPPLRADPLPVVGIGASAGGLEAFTSLLQHLPADTGCAFVLVQHLEASHPSALCDILGRVTTMVVAEAAEGMRVAANRVYVIPPAAELSISGRVLHLTPRVTGAVHMPIDRFMESLAEDCGADAIGVILSGGGSDGTGGLLAIKDAGGLTFAQEPTSAEFPSMPETAAAAGGADAILSPQAIAAQIVRFAGQPYLGPASVAALTAASPVDAGHLREICDLMAAATGIDFSLYRETMVLRRIQRRMTFRSAPDVTSYARLLAADPGERDALQRDLLIGVTSFFRDPASFEALKAFVFPVLARNHSADVPIRIWVPGCSTGEEAYSILIALQEYQAEAGTTCAVQVFASDISAASIEKARAGTYPEQISAVVSASRLRQHFSKVGGGYQIARGLREQCVFSRHNLLDDPPFSRLDLISCRNVLIYLDAVQRRIVPLFHYALVDDGFLMLGRAESPPQPEFFSAVDARQRLFVKRRIARPPYESFARARSRVRTEDAWLAPPRIVSDVSRDADRILASRYSPAAVLVDEGLHVLEIRGQTAPFLALTPGPASLHLLKMLPDTGLFLAVEALAQHSARTGDVARAAAVRYTANGRTGFVDVEVAPIRSRDRRASLILFETVPAPGTGASDSRPPEAADTGDATAHVAHLQEELQQARARLVSLIDEHQASDDDQRQIAEDALSANEELQSLTEELETAKEELQSTNEELLSMNRELEARHLALMSARDLAKAMVDTVGVPLMVVDADLVVRHLNGAFARTFQVSPSMGEGGMLAHLNGGAWNIAGIRTHLDRLLADRQPFDRVEVEQTFPPVGSRVLVLSGCPLQDLALFLLTIEDMTGQREAERALHRSEEQRRQSEKMETVGRLAGGIAHDFNNLLTVIIGNTDLIAELPQLGAESTAQVDDIRHAAERAASLTDQLLSFSRRKVLQPKVFDLNPLVADFVRMLRRVLGEPIKIVVRSSSAACLVKADPAEIGRVLMNLCVNARDAMPAGGILTVETALVTPDVSAGPNDESLGRSVRLVVADTGMGMDAETRAHIFEPFFSTKDASRGAGLGLATVFGILQQSGGTIACDSEPGQGARFTILLPEVPAIEEAPPPDVGLAKAPRGRAEVILLAEDDDGVRQLTTLVLQRAGYIVLEARDGDSAISVMRSHPGRIDLLISDVLMPEVSGGELVQRARALQADLKVLFVSGHTEDIRVKEGVTQDMSFLQKPYGLSELLRKTRSVLDDGTV